METRLLILRLPLDSWHQNKSESDIESWFWVLVDSACKTRQTLTDIFHSLFQKMWVFANDTKHRQIIYHFWRSRRDESLCTSFRSEWSSMKEKWPITVATLRLLSAMVSSLVKLWSPPVGSSLPLLGKTISTTHAPRRPRTVAEWWRKATRLQGATSGVARHHRQF